MAFQLPEDYLHKQAIIVSDSSKKQPDWKHSEHGVF